MDGTLASAAGSFDASWVVCGPGARPVSPPANIHVYVDVDVMPVKKRILLREDVRDHLIRRVGPRGLSEAINEILARSLFRSKKSLFGADPWLSPKGLRDERDPHEDL